MKVLVAEDDEKMLKILKLYLQKEGYEVKTFPDGRDALSYLESNRVDLLLLDWMLPGKSGVEICREVRTMKLPVKIIMITAKTTTDHEISGLTAGADDYIRKPFDMKVLLLRIKKLCHMENEICCGDIVLNPVTYEVRKRQQILELTRKEFELLKYLMVNQRRTLTREQILSHVWGVDYFGDVRTVDTHIRRLRKKIGEGYIRTMIGTGYRMGEEDE